MNYSNNYETYTGNDYQNEIAYLRTALMVAAESMQAIKDNIETGRFEIVVKDDGPAHPGNIQTMVDNLAYVNKCLEMTNPYIDHKPA